MPRRTFLATVELYQVSACVAKMRDNDAVETLADPADRRKTLVRPTESTLWRARSQPMPTIDADMAAAVGGDDPARLKRANEALETLAELFGHP